MSKTPYRHDAAYKSLFTDPEMVGSLLRRFVPENFLLIACAKRAHNPYEQPFSLLQKRLFSQRGG